MDALRACLHHAKYKTMPAWMQAVYPFSRKVLPVMDGAKVIARGLQQHRVLLGGLGVFGLLGPEGFRV
jgi:hypothetical protein